MSVMIYSNGAWQEASEVPKKYVNGAWEDSDGYAYENGAWVEKWSAKPKPFYIIQDGIRNTSLSYSESWAGSDAQYYSTAFYLNNGRQVASIKSKKGGYANYTFTISGIPSKIDLAKYTRLCWDGYYTYSNSVSDADADSTCRTTGMAWVNPNRSSRATTYDSISTSVSDLGIQVFSHAYKTTNQRTTTAYIYNLWFE